MLGGRDPKQMRADTSTARKREAMHVAAPLANTSGRS
jgi:hypothetical protein